MKYVNYVRNHIVSRLFCFLMALHVFNICVDMPDAQPDFMREDLTLNEMESVIEIILEKGLGIENAIAEYDDPDNDNNHDAPDPDMTKQVQVSQAFDITAFLYPQNDYLYTSVPYKDPRYSKYVNEISVPPPQA